MAVLKCVNLKLSIWREAFLFFSPWNANAFEKETRDSTALRSRASCVA